MNQDQFYAVRQARAWLEKKPLFLDIETTGFDINTEVINLALIDSDGQALINTLIRPTIPIPEEAAVIHGIHNDDIVDAPAFSEVLINLATLTEKLAYNRIAQTMPISVCDDLSWRGRADWRSMRQLNAAL